MISPSQIKVIEGSTTSSQAERPSVQITPPRPLLKGEGDHVTHSSYISVIGRPARPSRVDPVFRTRVLPGKLGAAATDLAVGTKTELMRLIVALRS